MQRIVCRLFAGAYVVIAGKKVPAGNAQGIEAEIPEALGTKAEELERKARFPALCAGNAPKREGCSFLCGYPDCVIGGVVINIILIHNTAMTNKKTSVYSQGPMND